MNLYDRNQRLVSLGARLGIGGEGEVFELRSSPSDVAKIYKNILSAQKEEKLRAMVALSAQELLKFAAWPKSTLHEKPNGRVVGFIMSRVRDHREIHTLYSPAHRKSTFPQADWRFLIQAALNSAIAFNALHHRGVVIGDVNQSNVLVSPQATVTLIDCDSFQFQANGNYFPCEVGVMLFTPPELQGMPSFHGLVRTTNHDCFGLAVLIFHLLFMGRHPFSGRFLGKGEMPLDRAIAEYRFAYSRIAASFQTQPPVHSMPMNVLSPQLIELFERAFGRTSAQTKSRPMARDWIASLDAFRKQLRTCKADPGHAFPDFLRACPWCELMSKGAPNFFVAVAFNLRARLPPFILATVWQKIESVTPPITIYQRPVVAGVLPRPLPSNIPRIIPPQFRIKRELPQTVSGFMALCSLAIVFFILIVQQFAAIAGLLGFIGFLVFGSLWLVLELLRSGKEEKLNEKRHMALAAIEQESDRRQEALQSAEQHLISAEAHWLEVAARFERSFKERVRELRLLHDRHDQIQKDYVSERQKLLQNAQTSQLELFLEQHFISDADIPQIGPGRKATLTSNGIETAFDIEATRILEVPGFGPERTRVLLEWRRTVERRFVFNAAVGIPPSQQQALEIKFFQLRQQIETRLQNGPDELSGIYWGANRELTKIMEDIRRCIRKANQAAADQSLIPDLTLIH
jgi:DNA-binding helix-hairpin-helix protein with protein kinase domain